MKKNLPTHTRLIFQHFGTTTSYTCKGNDVEII